MKSLKSFVSESLTKSDILAHRYDVQPSDWSTFKRLAEKEGFQNSLDDDKEEVVMSKEEVIARFLPDTLQVYTSLHKQTFFDVALRKKSGILTKLFK